MAVSRLGTYTLHQQSSDGNKAVTIPADASVCVVIVTGYPGATATPMFSTLNWDGAGLDFTLLRTQYYTPNYAQIGVYYMVSTNAAWPGSGGKTLNYTAQGYGEGYNILVLFYSGVDTSDPIVGSDGSNNLSTSWTSSIAGVSDGDMGIVAAYNYENSATTVTTGSQTQIVNTAVFNYSTIAAAEKASTGSLVVTRNSGDIIPLALVLRAESTSTTGTLSGTDGADTCAVSGSVGGEAVTGTVSATESADSSSASGEVFLVGALVVTESADGADLSADVSITGAFAVNEGADASVMAGIVALSGTISTIDGADLCAMVAVSGNTVTGTTTAVDGSDVFAATGDILATGTLNVTDGSDSLGASGSVFISGILSASESADAASISGTVDAGIYGNLSATEQSDVCAILANLIISGTIAATDGDDSAMMTYIQSRREIPISSGRNIPLTFGREISAPSSRTIPIIQ